MVNIDFIVHLLEHFSSPIRTVVSKFDVVVVVEPMFIVLLFSPVSLESNTTVSFVSVDQKIEKQNVQHLSQVCL